jgi:HSP20 family molecular chaperone IbpA
MCFPKDFPFNATFDDLAAAAKEFGERMKDMGPEMRHFWSDRRDRPGKEEPFEAFGFHDYYAYPPANVFVDASGAKVLEFALSGINEADASVTFQGDYLVLDAKAPVDAAYEDSRFTRRSFRPREIRRQKYYVPAEDYDHESAKAVFKNGILKVTVPPKTTAGGIKIDIVKEGN